MNTYRDLLSRIPKDVIGNVKDCRNHIYNNIETAINLILLESDGCQCIICKSRFHSILQYTIHLRLNKLHVVNHIQKIMMMQQSTKFLEGE